MKGMINMEKEIMIKSTTGLHAALAAKVVQTASKYTVEIELHYKDKVVDLKSILALMSLAIPHGENVRIVARGTRAAEAIKDVSSILG
ncbi:MAG: HPr family phosphocarrier protein [Acholeplasmataceae bacterium]|jgi:phosphocarrier protein